VAAEIHARITHAHPFIDGNGRVARALSTWILVKAGYRLRSNPRVFCRDRVEAYYLALGARDATASLDCPQWNAFFDAMVASCFDGPAIRQTPFRGRRVITSNRHWRAVVRRRPHNTPARVTPDRGDMSRGILVELRHQIPEAKLYFTIDGSDPTRMSTPYRGEFLLTFPEGQPVTVAAMAIVPEHSDSDVARHTYFPT
jgi:Fic/DOC family/Chitobiase/beta-hexosaminidase C-terminal domain